MRSPLLIFASLALVHCNQAIPNDQTPASVTQASTANNHLEVEDLGDPPEHVSLLVLDGKTDEVQLAREIESRLQGLVYHVLAPRMMVVSVPDGADAVLTQLGVATRYARAVDPSEIGNATINEQRFVRVFSNRYFPSTVTPKLALAPTHRVLAAGEPFEATAKLAPATSNSIQAALTPSSQQTTPFASGTIVVSLILPESNGALDPSTEDWTEDAINDAYLKVQTALEGIKRAEPNNDLRFIIHYESSPGVNGLPGTVDSDYEYGQHADFTNVQDELNVSAPMLARLLGHAVTPDQVFDASWEYLDGLRAQYHADGAYYIKIGCNTNGTATFRAHAFIGGPWNTLPSDQPWNVFMHESGHIFGALDEYCPDACTPTTALQGYLGIINANAVYEIGGDGIDNGMGEAEPSLMNQNSQNDVNGYTRGAWGWLDTDGDGIIEVRDTTPQTALAATVTGADVHLEGTIYDVPAKRNSGAAGISFNRIETVEYQFAGLGDGTWFALPVHQATLDGPVAIDLDLGNFPVGERQLLVRSRNSVGNVDVAQTLDVDVGGPSPNTAPHVKLEAAPATGSTRSTFTLTAHTLDLDHGDDATVQVRFDTNGDGVFDTQFGSARTITLQPKHAGIVTVVVEARDRHGATAQSSVRLFVLDKNTSPVVHIADAPSLDFGTTSIMPTFKVARATDADGDPLQLNWIAELATADQTFRTETGFAANHQQFTVTLPTPPTLLTTPTDLAAGDASLVSHTWVQSIALTPQLIATAAGVDGLVVTDLTNASKPVLVAHLVLQTDAQHLLLDSDGKTLFVLGTALTLVDVSHPRVPVEIQQTKVTRQTIVDVQSPRGGSEPIPDGDDRGASIGHALTALQPIASLEIDVEVNHPAPGELRFDLDYFNGQEDVVYTMRDHVVSAGGDKVYKFTTANTPSLAPLVGKLATGQIAVRVADTVPGNVGTLIKSTLTIKTASHAFTVLDGAAALAGVLPGHRVVVAGLGVQTLDASAPKAVKPVSLLLGTQAISAQVSGTTALVFSPLTIPPPDGGGGGKDATTATTTTTAVAPVKPATLAHGLYAVDLSNPTKPKVVRTDESFGEPAGTLAIFGSRFYVNPAGGTLSSPTQVDSVAQFIAGGAYQLGVLPTHVDGVTTTFGNDTTLWSVASGHVQAIDVSSPAAARVTADYVHPLEMTMTFLSGSTVLLFGAGQSSVANLNNTANRISRTYRITLQAQDSQGAIASETRTVQLIPYDHFPTVSAALTSGAKVGDTFTFTVTPADPDLTTTWDPDHFTRADLDGDGVFETEWEASIANRDGSQPVTFSTVFTTAGAHTVRFETRDTFYALSETALTVNVTR